jgi:hypothetical protein
VKPTNAYNPKHNLLARSLKGYLRFFRGILWLPASFVLVALTGLCIVYPLWYFASGYKNAYSLFALGVLLAAALFALAGKLKSSVHSAGGFGLWIKKRLFLAVKKTARFLLAALALYGLILLFVRGYILAASGGTLVYLVFLGIVLAGRRESR